MQANIEILLKLCVSLYTNLQVMNDQARGEMKKDQLDLTFIAATSAKMAQAKKSTK